MSWPVYSLSFFLKKKVDKDPWIRGKRSLDNFRLALFCNPSPSKPTKIYLFFNYPLKLKLKTIKLKNKLITSITNKKITSPHQKQKKNITYKTKVENKKPKSWIYVIS